MTERIEDASSKYRKCTKVASTERYRYIGSCCYMESMGRVKKDNRAGVKASDPSIPLI